MRAYLVDIDGTVANLSHRLHYIQGPNPDWPAFYAACDQDEPIKHMVDLIWTILKGDDFVLWVSGRSDEVREKTLDWLNHHFNDSFCDLDLYMRAAGDHRPDHEIKAELLEKIKADGYIPIMAFEDRAQVVKMWRQMGVPCAQVAEGDF